MKVLVFQGYVDPAGRGAEALLEAWPTLPGVCGAVSRAGCAVDVVVAARRDERVERDGVGYRFVSERVWPSPRRLLGHRAAPHPTHSLRVAGAISADVVHLHGLSFPRQARALKALHPHAPLLVQDHADRPPDGWRRRLHRWGYAGVDAAAFTSAEQAAPFLGAGILAPDVAVFAVPEGSSDFVPGDRIAARRSSGLDGHPLVAWVGDLTASKDPMTALDAFRRALTLRPAARLAMVFRGGALEPDVRRRVGDDPELRRSVTLVGALAHPLMAPFLRAADVLLAPSRREGSGYAVIEALACGTPVVASSIPSHREILGPGGTLLPPGDGAGMGAALVALASRGLDARAAARTRFDEALTFERIGTRLRDAYAFLLDRRRPKRLEGGS